MASETEGTTPAKAGALGQEPNRVLDPAALKGLAHPIRMEIFDTLAVHGPHTASGLAERLGESSGTTSYHLRQLERCGLVREVDGRGTARERWWERVPGPITISRPEDVDTPSAKATATTVFRHWEDSRTQLLHQFMFVGPEVLGPEWLEAAEAATANLRLTVEQLADLVEAWHAWSAEHLTPLRGQDLPGSRPVQIHFNAFPVVDGEVTPGPQRPRTRGPGDASDPPSAR